jgi:cytochrome c oxidase subunit II
MSTARLLTLLATALAVAACRDNSQSALAPAGLEATQIAGLIRVLLAFGAAVLLIVAGALLIALFGPARARTVLAGRSAIIGFGLAFPATTLLALFVYSTISTKQLLAGSDGPDSVTIRVTGEQWWWRVTYTTEAGNSFESANEVQVPVGRPVVFELRAADVIHSFWIPSLGGKMDMIPGRTTRLRLTAARAGVYRGQCAEYCGGPHALMAFTVVAKDPQEYADWIERRSAPAKPPANDEERNGAALFAAAGCGGCHAVDGTAANGGIGPNLTHLGGRRSVGIDQSLMSRESIIGFLAEGQKIKPGNHMPEFKVLRPHEREAIASYLLGLK